MLGDIDVGEPGIQFETQEMKDAHQAAQSAWSLGKNAGKTGIIVIIARDLVNDAGVSSGSAGANPGHSATLDRNNGADLCVVPRHLTVADVADQYVMIKEPKQLPSSGEVAANFYRVLAHELGHTLLLSHGDGHPNGGTLPPNNGPRKFGTDCGGGPDVGVSLMSPTAPSNIITVLQRELARDAAVLVPGHTGPISASAK